MRDDEGSRPWLGEVSNVLWRERRLLGLLVDRLELERLLAAIDSLWLLRAARELEAIRAELHRSELDRAMAVVAGAADLGLGPDATLSALAAAADDPWSELLAQHRTALRAAISAATHQSRLTRRLLIRAVRSPTEASAGNGLTDQRAPGRPASEPSLLVAANSRPCALQAALAATTPVRPPSLLDFLR